MRTGFAMTRRRRVRARKQYNFLRRKLLLLAGRPLVDIIQPRGKRAGRVRRVDRRFERAHRRWLSVESNRELLRELAKR